MVKTRVVAVDAEHPDPGIVSEAASIIQSGGLVAIPTETVYGLGASALDTRAVERIFEVKGRPQTDPLIVHLAHVGQLGRVAQDVSPVARKLALAFWAGPLTLVLKKQPSIPDAVTASLPTVAVRVPSHRVARALIETLGVPIAAPSANRFSRPSPTRAEHVLSELDGYVDLILDAGPTPVGVESTILDCTQTPPVLLRPGGITREALAELVPDLVMGERFASAAAAQVAPGQLTRHYSPTARLTLFEGEAGAVQSRLEDEARTLAARGQRIGILAPEEDVLALAPALAAQAATGRVRLRAYGAREAPERSAAELFDALRSLDADKPDQILASGVGSTGMGAAVRDRLMRAAEGRVIRV